MVLQRINCVFGKHLPVEAYAFQKAPFGLYVEVVLKTTCQECQEVLDLQYAVDPPKDEPHRTLIQERPGLYTTQQMWRAVCWCDWRSSWLPYYHDVSDLANKHVYEGKK